MDVPISSRALGQRQFSAFQERQNELGRIDPALRKNYHRFEMIAHTVLA